MSEPCFVSVAFGDRRYIDQQARLKESILKIYPDAPLYFWTNKLPDESRKFSDSLYGFKPHAVNHALNNGYTRIVFFDPACILMQPIDYYQSIVGEYGVIAVQDDNKLNAFCYDKALKFFGLQRSDITKWHLVGGSFYYFDFSLHLCNVIFDKWIEAERYGFFGSQAEQASGKLHGHRSDEAIMSLALYTSGSRPLSEDARYRCEVCIVDKNHFK